MILYDAEHFNTVSTEIVQIVYVRILPVLYITMFF